MAEVRSGANNRQYKKSTLMPTRLEFHTMDLDDILDGMCIRSYDNPAWQVFELKGNECEDLPKLTRSQFAQTLEKQLPRDFIITHIRKPILIVRSL